MRRRRVTGTGRPRPGRRGSRAPRARGRPAAFRWAGRPRLRRAVLAAALVAVLLIPVPVLASDTAPRLPGCAGSGCAARAALAERWAVRLAGYWSAGTGPGTTGEGGTVPSGGQAAYVAAGGGLAVVATGLTVTAYAAQTGRERWSATLAAPAGAQVVSVRAWPGVVTVGLLGPGGSRTAAVLNAAAGTELRHYPAAALGGVVSASSATTVVIGSAAVTSYDNATGRVRWQRAAAGDQPWRTDGQTLYLAQSPGGAAGSSPVTALKVINLGTGAERVLGSPLGQPFPGTLALAADGAVVFASPAGVTAYSGATGGMLWRRGGWVPEGADPAARQADFTTPDGALVGADPLTGRVRATVPAAAAAGQAAAVYVVRDGIALGLDSGASGDAWGYDMAQGKVSWTSAALPWPHFYADPSGLGGSAATAGSLVVVTACPHLAASQGLCADPELVAFSI